MRQADLFSTAGHGLGSFYLSRLDRLVRLRLDFEEHLNPLGVALMERSIIATYRDCIENGKSQEAQDLMSRLEGVAGPWGS